MYLYFKSRKERIVYMAITFTQYSEIWSTFLFFIRMLLADFHFSTCPRFKWKKPFNTAKNEDFKLNGVTSWEGIIVYCRWQSDFANIFLEEKGI